MILLPVSRHGPRETRQQQKTSLSASMRCLRPAHADARGSDDDAQGGEFTVDSAVAQVGFSFANRRTGAMVPLGIAGRPGRLRE